MTPPPIRRAGAWVVSGFALLLVLAAACRQEPSPPRTATTRATAQASAESTSSAAALPRAEPFPTRLPSAARVIAIGDLHGDLAATRHALRLGGVIGDGDRWTGGQTVVVQTGDVLDRGDDERAIIDLLAGLATEAARAGGGVHVLNGNHELMNVAGDMRYVTPAGLREFESLPGLRLDEPALARAPAAQRARIAAFAPGGPYARKLAPHPVVLLVGGHLFVHGGVLPQHVEYGLERINQESRDWLLGRSLRGRRLVARRDSPLWVRRFSGPPDEVDCAELGRTLELARADRMVVGHTVQSTGITSACDGRIWRIDAGLAAHYGGPVEVLELTPERVHPLREADPRRP